MHDEQIGRTIGRFRAEILQMSKMRFDVGRASKIYPDPSLRCASRLLAVSADALADLGRSSFAGNDGEADYLCLLKGWPQQSEHTVRDWARHAAVRPPALPTSQAQDRTISAP